MKRLLLVAVAAFAVLAFSTSSANAKEPDKPQLRPGFAASGTVTSPTVFAAAGTTASTTFDGPYGPITLSVTANTVAPASGSGVTPAVGVTNKTCQASESSFSWRMTLIEQESYIQGYVIQITNTYSSSSSIPLWGWSNIQTGHTSYYNANRQWADLYATLTYGVGWLATGVARAHVNINADAWGNCTGSSTLSWF